MQCIAQLAAADEHENPTEEQINAAINAKMQLVGKTKELMPDGVPSFLEIVKYPTIKQLTKQIGDLPMTKVLLLLVKDFCNSLNVVRNMNENQMIEVASMLLDECDNFRLEDYYMMFTMAKRGRLGKIYDRVDIQVFSSMMDEYYRLRREAGEKYFEQKEQEQKNLLYQKSLPASTEEEDRVTQMWHEMAVKMKEQQKEEEKRRRDELEAKKSAWAAQAQHVGINVQAVIANFSKNPKNVPKLTAIQKRVLEVYGILKYKTRSLEKIAEILSVDMNQIIKIVNLEIRDEQVLSEFIQEAEIAIQEMERN